MSQHQLPESPQTSPPSLGDDDDDPSVLDHNEFDPTDDDSHNSDFHPVPQTTNNIHTQQLSSQLPLQQQQHTLPENLSLTSAHASPTQKRRNHHNTHTRRCRARLNGRFDALNNMLPRPSTTEVKHKVQILDHAISALQQLHQDNIRLELFLAMRSRPRMIKWVDTFVPNATCIQAALDPFLNLLHHTGTWPYAEVWKAHASHMTLMHTSIRATSIQYRALCNLRRYPSQQQSISINADFAGCVFETKLPAWSTSPIQACRVAHRAQLMAAARLHSAFAVPIPVAGDIPYVVVFYDMRPRNRDASQVAFACFAAVCIGNAWAAKQAEARPT